MPSRSGPPGSPTYEDYLRAKNRLDEAPTIPVVPAIPDPGPAIETIPVGVDPNAPHRFAPARARLLGFPVGQSHCLACGGSADSTLHIEWERREIAAGRSPT